MKKSDNSSVEYNPEFGKATAQLESLLCRCKAKSLVKLSKGLLSERKYDAKGVQDLFFSEYWPEIKPLFEKLDEISKDYSS